MRYCKFSCWILAVCLLFSCDAADNVEPDSPWPSADLSFNLAHGLKPLEDALTGEVDLSNCFVSSTEGTSKLVSGRLYLNADKSFRISYTERQHLSPDSTMKDLSGTFEVEWPFLRLKKSGDELPLLLATIGPSKRKASTIVLGDYSHSQVRWLVSQSGCSNLVFNDDQISEDRNVDLGSSEEVQFQLAGLYATDSTLANLPYQFGRMSNNVYHSGLLEFSESGTYKFSFDRTWGNEFVVDQTERRIEVSAGPYVKTETVFVLDPGTSKMAFALDYGDGLRLYRNWVTPSYWGIDLYTDADLQFRQE